VAETSALFRIRVDDIQKKLVDIGLIPSPSRAKRRQDEDDGSQSSSPSPSTDDFMLDVDALELLGLEYGIDTVRSAVDDFVFADSKRLLMQQRRSDEKLGLADSSQAQVLRSRPPVVSVMGHVDHGKTTLMDALRRRSQKKLPGGKTKPNSKMSKKQQKESGGSKSGDVAGTEAGGITQVISAFQVAVEGYDDMITFLDTPGHAAFSAMRQSGSHAADVIVLVIAADDGVSPQTVEILNMYKSIAQGSSDSGISMVVALNKIDKPGIDVDEAKRRIENQLLEHGIVPEGMDTGDSEFGQPVQVIPTSGLTGLGLDDLIEGLMLQSEIMDLRADNEAPGEGIVMDARIEKGLGVVADCIIRLGKIESGSFIMSGDQVARVRMLKDVNDKTLKTGLPSQPVRIVGFRELPKAGDPIVVVDSEEAGEEILRQRLALNSSGENLTSDRPDGERSDLSLQIHGMRRGDSWRVKKVHEKAGIEAGGDSTRIPVIVKADADGSLSAIRDSLLKLADNSTKHNVIIDPVSEGIGEITMSDIQLAKESDATIFAFGLSRRIDQATLNLAESEGVKICSNDIIYALLDEAKEVLGRHLPPTPKEHVHGRALVQAVFMIDTPEGKEQVAGLKVTDGHIYKDKAKLRTTEAQILLDCAFRVYRDGEQIAPGLNEASSSRKDAVLKASSLRKFKELVDSVRMGEECGLALSGYSEFQEGDEIDCYSIEMKPTKL
jgi:translation initiation factor IF-2